MTKISKQVNKISSSYLFFSFYHELKYLILTNDKTAISDIEILLYSKIYFFKNKMKAKIIKRYKNIMLSHHMEIHF